MIVEVCCEGVESVVTAREAGAHRVEFCDNMAEGGTTPSAGQIWEARQVEGIKLYPIIRPRGGDFCYTDREFEVMLRDVEWCGAIKCDGVVIGILDKEGNVDMERCSLLVESAHDFGMGVTFHRALDVSSDLSKALEDVIELGCERVLTSGGAATALEGVDKLRELVEQAGDRITIMAGSGVTPENAALIVEGTGVREIHGTFRSRFSSDVPHPAWAEFDVWHADEGKIRRVVALEYNNQ